MDHQDDYAVRFGSMLCKNARSVVSFCFTISSFSECVAGAFEKPGLVSVI
jgi:hypothetical protein